MNNKKDALGSNQVPPVGRQFGIEHLEQLNLISERGRQAFEGPPPTQKKNITEWEQARMELENQGKHTDCNFGKVNVAPSLVLPTFMTDEDGTGLILANTKQKVKSGKYAKCNANLIREECWPHIAVLKRSTKRVSFDQSEFEAFVAGET